MATKTGTKNVEITAKNTTREEADFLRRHKSNLSRTTLRAKWIHSPDEHEDRTGQSLATREHEVIKHWAEDAAASLQLPATPIRHGAFGLFSSRQRQKTAHRVVGRVVSCFR